MDRFEFVTNKGTATIGYGCTYVLTSVEGLNECDVSRQTTKYIDTDGADYKNSLYEPKMVTIKGFIKANSKAEIPRYRAELSRLLNGKDKGILYYYNDIGNYFSEAIAEIPQFGTAVQNVLPFVIYFNLYKVFWKSAQINTANIYQRIGNLKTPFTLPCVFTTRINKAELINNGDLEADMIITVTCSSHTAPTSGYGLIVKNNTTDKFTEIDYDMAANEVITIDTAKCSVKSSINGDILYAMTDTSLFFKLECGVNEIEGTNLNTASNISIKVDFYNVLGGV